jgi:hypothetical protein
MRNLEIRRFPMKPKAEFHEVIKMKFLWRKTLIVRVFSAGKASYGAPAA